MEKRQQAAGWKHRQCRQMRDFDFDEPILNRILNVTVRHLRAEVGRMLNQKLPRYNFF
jgi:hypothetical protein